MRRVVITSIGALTPIGNDMESTWKAAAAGVNGIKEIAAFDTTNFAAKTAGEVKNFDPLTYLSRRDMKRMDRFMQLGIPAAMQAWEAAKIDMSKEDPYKIGVLVGSGMGGMQTTIEEQHKLDEKGPRRVSPLFIPKAIINLAPGNIAIQYGLKGPNYGIVTACASGTDAIGHAFRLIKSGVVDGMLTGGAEAMVIPLAVAGFQSMKALSTNPDPDLASRPFDKDRDGFVIGEGACFLMMEELEHALDRGADIIAEIAGYGQTCDAYHITAPDPEAVGQSKAMEMACEDGGIEKTQVGYINAHGTSTPINDKYETLSIIRCFGEYANKLAISSTKSMTGHMLGAGGAVEAAITAMALKDGFLPPTIGLKNEDEVCTLDYIKGVGRKTDAEYALTNSFGFGGHNASLLLRKFS